MTERSYGAQFPVKPADREIHVRIVAQPEDMELEGFEEWMAIVSSRAIAQLSDRNSRRCRRH